MDKRTWDSYDEAIAALEAARKAFEKDPKRSEPYEVSRFEATEICGMSPSVFGREVPRSSLFRAYYKEPRYTGKSSYYKIDDLIEHLKRIKERRNNVELLHQYFEKGEDWFDKNYAGDAEFVFEDGTYLPIGDFNKDMF